MVIVEAQLKSNFMASEQKELYVFWEIGELRAGLKKIIQQNPETCACAKNFADIVPPLNLDIFALITDGNKYELIVLEVKLVKGVGLKKYSQLVGYCLVSGARYGLLINVDNGASPRLKTILQTEKNISQIKTLVKENQRQHLLVFMQWNSITQNFEYSGAGKIKTLAKLSVEITQQFQ